MSTYDSVTGALSAREMQLILGLDLGASSIGWTLLRIPRIPEDEDRPEFWMDSYFEGGKIIKAGVRLFAAGKDNFDSAKEKSLAEDRRKARGGRRRLRRRNERKRKLKELLAENGFWPDQMGESTDDPLELRAKGIEQRIDLMEFGRILYHLAQRRGFRSARKTKVGKPGKGKTKSDENVVSEDMKSGDTEEKKENILAKIEQLSDEIEKSGRKTLGAYLFSLREQSKHVRIRKRYTRRDMYIKEFELLWEKQATYYSDILTTELKARIHDLLFFQRNIYWKQTTIGRCEFEPDEPRCPRADRLAQAFRFFQEINNLKYIDPNTDDEIRVADDQAALKKIVELGRKKENIKFDEIRKILGLEGTSTRFNLESAKKKKGKKAESEEDVFRKELKGFETDAVLRRPKYFGKNWDTIPEDERDKIVRILIERPADPDSGRMEFDAKGRARQMDEERFRGYMEEHWKKPYGLTDEQIDEILDNIETDLPKNYLSLSRKALAKLLPFMQRGLLFSGPMEKDGSYNDALHGAGYVRRDEENEWEHFHELPLAENLGELGTINNPVVRRIVNETRRLINAVIRQYGRPDRIHVELARNAKASSELRKKMTAQNNQNKKEREEARNNLRGENINPTGDALLRYRLWKQQGEVCPYSGQHIGFHQLFSESVIDIDHILPYSRTLDDSQMNKVVCFASANRDKEDQTPYEWLARRDPERFEEVKERVAKYPYKKRTRFEQKEIDEEGFTARQLIDTQYASRYLLQYLRCLYTPEEWKACRRIRTVKGGHTSDLRHFWGLNYILHESDFLPENLPPGEKNRGDHRHHAIDALVIALTDEKQLKRLGLHKYRQHKQSFPHPWGQFRRDAEKAINEIVVSHRPAGRVRGGLHEETNYGPVFDRKSGKQEEGVFVVRKALTSLTSAEFFRIRDERIKKLVFERLAAFGIKPVQKGKKEGSEKLEFKPDQIKRAFAEPLYLEPGEKKASTPSKHLTEIKKVRIFVNNQTAQQVKQDGPFVIPGSNHHICLFEYMDAKGKPVREAVFTSRLEANRRLSEQQRLIREKRKELEKQGLSAEETDRRLREYRRIVVTELEPLVRRVHPERPTARFLFTLKRGEMFRTMDGDIEHLVVLKRSGSTSGQLFFIDTRDAQKKPKEISKTGASYFDIIEKVQIDRLGRITPAKD